MKTKWKKKKKKKVIFQGCKVQFCKVIYKFDSKDSVEASQEDEPRPALNAHIQDIQFMLLKIGDHKIVFKARKGKIAKEDLFV